jgi:hypothetical protein
VKLERQMRHADIDQRDARDDHDEQETIDAGHTSMIGSAANDLTGGPVRGVTYLPAYAERLSISWWWRTPWIEGYSSSVVPGFATMAPFGPIVRSALDTRRREVREQHERAWLERTGR